MPVVVRVNVARSVVPELRRSKARWTVSPGERSAASTASRLAADPAVPSTSCAVPVATECPSVTLALNAA